MKLRVLVYGVTRPSVLVLAAVGAVLILRWGWLIPGAACLGLAAVAVLRLFGDRQTGERLRLQNERRRYQVARTLWKAEMAELALLERYIDALRDSGCASDVTSGLWQHAWALIKKAGLNEATLELREFRKQLPELADGSKPGGPSDADTERALRERLQREVALINAAEREISNLRAP
jgi:hypothetical protein